MTARATSDPRNPRTHPPAPVERVIVVVLDGVGIAPAPDAALWGDADAATLPNVSRAVGAIRLPRLAALGIGRIADVSLAGDGGDPAVDPDVVRRSAVGVLHPRAAGRDSTTGHWELMGCVLERPFPVYPEGFPDEIVRAFERAIGRGVLGNRPASGTAILEELGAEHVRTGRPILYTSADSVFQLAAHEDVVPVDTLYAWCRTARELLRGEHAVARVIARPFTGEPGAFRRTPRRHDWSLEPPRDTVLDRLAREGRRVLAVGKIADLFAGRGVTTSLPTRDNRDGMARTLEAVRDDREHAMVFTNLVDFDTMWGHRNDARAFALGLEEFDAWLAELLAALRARDLLLIAADHGVDPTTPGTDHTRESVPVVAVAPRGCAPRDVGERPSLADLGATVAEALGVEPPAGRSFLGPLLGRSR